MTIVGFWGLTLVTLLVVAVTASLVVAVVRVMLLAERSGAGRSESTRQVAGQPPGRESLPMTRAQSRELEEEWASLVARLR